MPIISLPTGKSLYISAYEYYFVLEDKDIDQFFQSCVADDLGIFAENPFSDANMQGKLDIEDIPDELPVDFPD